MNILNGLELAVDTGFFFNALSHQALARKHDFKHIFARIQLKRLHGGVKRHLSLPTVPMLFPKNESLRVIAVDMQVPVDSHEP